MNKALLFGILVMGSLFASEEDDAEVEDIFVELVGNLEVSEEPAYLPTYQPELVPSIEGKKKSYDRIVYGQVEFILPGGGIGLRAFRKRIGYEGNFSFVIPALKSSASVLVRLGSRLDKGAYAGAGLGGVFIFDGEGFPFPFAPIFVGYEGKNIFWDFGFDLFPFGACGVSVLPIPILRCGKCF